MPIDPDLLRSKPQTFMENMLQWGDFAPTGDNQHILAVQEAIESLDPLSRQCIEAVFYEGISYNTLGKRMNISKVHAWRLSRKAMAELQRKLAINHSINMRYKMFEYWEEAAEAIVEEWGTLCMPSRAHLPHLNAYRKAIARCVREQKEISRLDIVDVAHQAIGELKFTKQWSNEEMLSLLVRKQRDYGHSNIMEFGHVGIAIRLCDKLARLKTLLDNGAEPQNESLLDTWMDLVGYSVISEMLAMGTFELELKD